MPQDPVERCVAENKLTFVAGHAELQGLNRNPGTVTMHYSGGSFTHSSFRPSTNSYAPRTSLTGYTPYLGTERISPSRALSLLGDPALEQRYEASAHPYRRGRLRWLKRFTWVTLLIGATAMLGAGIIESLDSGYDPETDTTDWNNTFVYLGSSIGGYLLMIPFLLLDLPQHDNANQLQVRRSMLVMREDIARDIAAANVARDERLAADCR